jgi:predicted dehydrogenase
VDYTGARSGHREDVRLAVLGCGAVSEIFHLPAAERAGGIRVVVLVDRDVERARALGSRFGVADVRDTFEGLDASSCDAALVALPNRLHAPVSIDLLSRGVSVLVEKPMALTADEARAMVRAAEAGGTVLQVALQKRFAWGARLVKQAVEHGLLGTIERFSIEWGENFSWPLASAAGMQAAEAGGGVLTDFGSHMLDLLCWWFGEPVSLEYADDSRGGVEADCELSLTVEGDAGVVRGAALFSRVRTLSNTVRIEGSRLCLEWAHARPAAVRTWPRGWSGDPPEFVWQPEARQSPEDLYAQQLAAFADAVSTGGASPVSGESVVPGLELIERCYRDRRRLTLPWELPLPRPSAAAAVAP